MNACVQFARTFSVLPPIARSSNARHQWIRLLQENIVGAARTDIPSDGGCALAAAPPAPLKSCGVEHGCFSRELHSAQARVLPPLDKHRAFGISENHCRCVMSLFFAKKAGATIFLPRAISSMQNGPFHDRLKNVYPAHRARGGLVPAHQQPREGVAR